MGKANFTEESKLDALKQITECGHSVADVSKRLGVSTHSLYGWMKRYAASPTAAVKDDQSAGIRRLKQELARVTEERDILKRGEPLRTRISPRMQNEIRVHQGASPAVQCAHHVQYAQCSPKWILCVGEASVQQTDIDQRHQADTPIIRGLERGDVRLNRIGIPKSSVF